MQSSPIGTSNYNSSAAYATPTETMEPFGTFEVDRDVVADAQQGGTLKPFVLRLKPGQGSVSSVSNVPSPAIHG